MKYSITNTIKIHKICPHHCCRFAKGIDIDDSVQTSSVIQIKEQLAQLQSQYKVTVQNIINVIYGNFNYYEHIDHCQMIEFQNYLIQGSQGLIKQFRPDVPKDLLAAIENILKTERNEVFKNVNMSEFIKRFYISKQKKKRSLSQDCLMKANSNDNDHMGHDKNIRCMKRRKTVTELESKVINNKRMTGALLKRILKIKNILIHSASKIDYAFNYLYNDDRIDTIVFIQLGYYNQIPSYEFIQFLLNNNSYEEFDSIIKEIQRLDDIIITFADKERTWKEHTLITSKTEKKKKKRKKRKNKIKGLSQDKMNSTQQKMKELKDTLEAGNNNKNLDGLNINKLMNEDVKDDLTSTIDDDNWQSDDDGLTVADKEIRDFKRDLLKMSEDANVVQKIKPVFSSKWYESLDYKIIDS